VLFLQSGHDVMHRGMDLHGAAGPERAVRDGPLSSKSPANETEMHDTTDVLVQMEVAVLKP
jgi:hypothetical protein